MKSVWGKDKKDPGLTPDPFCLAQWQRARRLPADPANPPKIGESNPFGDWEKYKCSKQIKALAFRDKALAFCPPLPNSILIEAFKDLETQDKTKVAYKRCHENLKHVGASMHALLYSAVPIFSLKEKLVQFSKTVREEGVLPWSSLEEGPDSF